LAFRGDGAQVAAAGEDHEIRVIHVSDAKEVKTLKGPDAKIHALAWMPTEGKPANKMTVHSRSCPLSMG